MEIDVKTIQEGLLENYLDYCESVLETPSDAGFAMWQEMFGE